LKKVLANGEKSGGRHEDGVSDEAKLAIGERMRQQGAPSPTLFATPASVSRLLSPAIYNISMNKARCVLLVLGFMGGCSGWMPRSVCEPRRLFQSQHARGTSHMRPDLHRVQTSGSGRLWRGMQAGLGKLGEREKEKREQASRGGITMRRGNATALPPRQEDR
jgi:hypothetical protein